MTLSPLPDWTGDYRAGVRAVCTRARCGAGADLRCTSSLAVMPAREPQRLGRRRRPDRHSRWERRLRRSWRTLTVVALVSGSLAYLAIGVLSKFDLAEQPTYRPLFIVCVTVFLLAAGARVLWGLAVHGRKLVLGRPRRRALQAMATRIGWLWQPKRRHVPRETIDRLLQIDPVPWVPDHDPKPRYTELAYGSYAGRPALSVHIERGSPLLPRVDQIVAVEMPGILPRLRITDRADDPYGFAPDQQFESARFNRTWGVHAENDRYASAFTHPRMMALLTSLDPSIEALHVRGAWLVSEAPVTFGPELLQRHLDALLRVVDQVPGWVWDEFGHRAVDRHGAGRSAHR